MIHEHFLKNVINDGQYFTICHMTYINRGHQPLFTSAGQSLVELWVVGVVTEFRNAEKIAYPIRELFLRTSKTKTKCQFCTKLLQNDVSVTNH